MGRLKGLCCQGNKVRATTRCYACIVDMLKSDNFPAFLFNLNLSKIPFLVGSKIGMKVDLWAGLVVLFRVGFCERELQSSGRIQSLQPLKPSYSLLTLLFPRLFPKARNNQKDNLKIQYVHNEDHLTISIVYKTYKLFVSYRAIVTRLIYRWLFEGARAW